MDPVNASSVDSLGSGALMLPSSVLTTERLVLRPWSIPDLPAFHALWSDPRVIWWGPAADEAASRALLERATSQTHDGLGWFAIVERASGKIVGNGLLKPAAFTDGIELGYHLAVNARGLGYATEAGAALLRHGLGTLGLARIVAAVVPGNTASKGVLARLGMRGIGEVVHAGLLHELFAVDAPAR